MFSVAIFLAASTANKHHVDWTAVTALTALFSSVAAILVAILNPFFGYTRARLEMLTDRLEKLYQTVKEERKAAQASMIHYRTHRPVDEDREELKKSAEDFRKLIEGKAEVDVLVALFFTRLITPAELCKKARNRFVNCWYDLYNNEVTTLRFQDLLKAEREVQEAYIFLEEVIKIEALELSGKQTATGLINVTAGELIRIFRKRSR
jgi:hypothetical protein